ncbi:hypothetical protein PAEVO_35950 [Paenibacillus sp. GM2FR]|nr:hypothetical protein PAEVO_35950 [Paenibacillus sp. GM2FR]
MVRSPSACIFLLNLLVSQSEYKGEVALKEEQAYKVQT